MGDDAWDQCPGCVEMYPVRDLSPIEGARGLFCESCQARADRCRHDETVQKYCPVCLTRRGII